jgi:hypothetical protein
MDSHTATPSDSFHLFGTTSKKGSLTRMAPQACAASGCHGIVEEPWETKGLYCPACAIDLYLFDREARWEDQPTQVDPVRQSARPPMVLSRLIRRISRFLNLTTSHPERELVAGRWGGVLHGHGH